MRKILFHRYVGIRGMFCVLMFLNLIKVHAQSYTYNNACPATTVDLTAHAPLSTPVGTTVTYHTSTPATASNKVPTPTAIGTGTYYMAFEDATNNCYSPTQTVTVTINSCATYTYTNACPATTVDLTAHAPLSTPAGTTVTYHTSTPATTSNKVAMPTAVGVGTYYMAFEDAVNGCYSPTQAVSVTINTCTPCVAGTTAPAISGTTLINSCPATTVSLNSLYTGTTPSGASLVWFDNNAHAGSPLSNPAAVNTAGTYYAFYYDGINVCYSPASTGVTVTINSCGSYTFNNVCPAMTVDLTAHAPLSTPAGTTVTYHTSTPATASNKVATPTAVGAGTYYMAFEDAPNNCYSPTQLVTVSITTCNTAPIAINDIAVTPEGKPFSGNVLTNDSDPDGTPLTVITTPISNSSKGTVVLNPNGTFTYTPMAGQTGEDKFCYAVTDGSLHDTACVTINIIANPTIANNKPVANDDNTQTTLNANIVINVKSNDTDPDGNNTLAIPTSLGSLTARGGTVTNNNDGTFTYAPLTGFIGKDSIPYQICDTGSPSLCDTAWVTVEVLPTPPTGNQSPVAMDDAALTLKGTPVTIPVKNNDNDADGNALFNPAIVMNPTNGTVIVNANGTVTYTPTSPTFTGSDVFTYQICDNGLPILCDTATVVISVNPAANKQPIAQNDIAVTPEGKPTTGNVLTNDSDPDGTPLMVITTPVVPPTKGTVVINADGTFTYTPTAGQTGEDKFCYAATDGSLRDTACVTVNIVANPTIANNKPVANDDNTQTTMNTAVTINVKANDTDADGSNTLGVPTPLSITARGGIMVNNSNGTFTYQPPTGFVGKDSVQYRICDNGSPSLCDSAWVTVEVLPTPPAGNQSPVAMDDAAVTLAGTTAIIPVKANDADPDGGTLGNPTIVTNPTNGTAVVNADGTVTYTPTNPTFTGADYFTYQICDNGSPSKCDTATVIVSIEPLPNTAPIATNDIALTPEGKPVTGNVLTNDKDPDGTPLTVITTPVVAPTKGTVVLNPDGTYTYTPTAGQTGEDTFCYAATDGSLKDTACVTVNIVPNPTTGNDKPVANNDNTQTTMNTPIVVNVKSNDTDHDGNSTLGTPTPLSITTAAGGTIVNNNDGTFTYTPPTGFVGKDSVQYQICDNGTPSLCDVAWMTVEVLPTAPAGNQSPVAIDDAALTTPSSPVVIAVKANDTDPESGTLGAPTVVSGPTHGTVSINPDGTVTYTPTSTTYTGPDVFTYSVCDNGSPSKCDTATVSVSIEPLPNSPVILANPDVAATIAGTLVNIPILTNDTNNGSAATLTNVTAPVITQLPTKGSATVKADGTIDYTPNATASGTDTLIYQICDKTTTTTCDTAIVYINIGIKLLPRAYLLGCYNQTTDLMHDSLRRKNLIPLQQPYGRTEYSDIAYTGTESISSSVLSVTGNNAIVDWVMVELRSSTDPKAIVARRAALIQRDGDIVDLDGVSPVMFGSVNPASYYVMVKHRNHLGVMTGLAQPLTFVPLVVDFTLVTLDNYKTTSLDKDFAQKVTTNGKRAMWMGNIKKDNAVIFQGPNNDVNELYLNVLIDANNGSFLANYILNGYLRGDVDLDGKTIYQGPGNETDKIFFEVVLHPINATYLYNFIINEQIAR